jgi:hypothetical protein
MPCGKRKPTYARIGRAALEQTVIARQTAADCAFFASPSAPALNANTHVDPLVDAAFGTVGSDIVHDHIGWNGAKVSLLLPHDRQNLAGVG